MIDEQGYRANVGIVLCNQDNQVLWAHRLGHDDKAWQFPQGGIHEQESPVEAMYRELSEEVGLDSDQVELLGQTQDWLTYQFDHTKVTSRGDRYIGQKQKWFLLRLLADESNICLTNSHPQEFDAWRWVDYDYPALHIVAFKKQVYQQALSLLRTYLC
jgi:putative (di)nucleoside polyphosphate hydrolase